MDNTINNSLVSNSSGNLISLNKAVEELVGQVFDYNSPEHFKENVLVSRDGTPVVARGEITVVAGPRKSFKSHICAAIAASAIGCEPHSCLNFEATSSLNVLYVDTEQSSASTAEICKCITHFGDPRKFIPYNWRRADPNTRAAALIAAINVHHPDVVIVDGIVDLVKDYDFNNIIESSKLVDDLLKIAQDCRCGIITVIHFNPSTSKERGSLGTILCNKAYGYLGLMKTKNYVTVSSADSARKKQINEFIVEFDENLGTIREVLAGFHPGKEPSPVETGTGNKCSSIDRHLSSNKKEMLATIKGLFSTKHPDFTHTELTKLLMEACNIPDANRTTATSAIKKAVELKIIKKGIGPRGRYSLFDDMP